MPQVIGGGRRSLPRVELVGALVQLHHAVGGRRVGAVQTRARLEPRDDNLDGERTVVRGDSSALGAQGGARGFGGEGVGARGVDVGGGRPADQVELPHVLQLRHEGGVRLGHHPRAELWQ
eukprot:scaffold6285_cov121-Isochrysis_galbana.AAC.25